MRSFSGAVFIENGNAANNYICGVVMAYNNTNIRLWAPTFGSGSDKCE